MRVPVNYVEPNKFNPNTMSPEIFETLKTDVARGDYDAIVVSPKNIFYGNTNLPHDRYVILDGEHRWNAAVVLPDVDTIDIDVKELKESEAKSYNYRRNKERGSLDPMKEAALFKSEVDEGLTQQEIADKFNVSQTYIAQRIGLLKLDETVIELYQNPDKTFRELKIEEHKENMAKYQEKLESANSKSERLSIETYDKPDEIKEEDLIPRGIITPSHLEVISILPPREQVEIAKEIIDNDMNVRSTEQQVKIIKEDRSKLIKFEEALAIAERPKCPKCGSVPEGFYYSNENWFTCSKLVCHYYWEYMKSQKKAEPEETEHDDKDAEMMGEYGVHEPKYIKRPETPQEIDEKIRPWILKKINQLTDIESVNIKGTRDNETVTIEYSSPDRARMKLKFRVDMKMNDIDGQIVSESFGLNVEPKDYKYSEDKSKVNLTLNEANEESRNQIRRFLDLLVITDLDPWNEPPRVRRS